MTEQDISHIASQVASDTKFWIALIGIIGAIIGSILTVAGNIALEWFKGKNKETIDNAKQSILKEMLEEDAFKWRNISTLSAVIGCSEDETKMHLIFIKARGSENGDGKWGLISRNPLKDIKRKKPNKDK